MIDLMFGEIVAFVSWCIIGLWMFLTVLNYDSPISLKRWAVVVLISGPIVWAMTSIVAVLLGIAKVYSLVTGVPLSEFTPSLPESIKARGEKS